MAALEGQASDGKNTKPCSHHWWDGLDRNITGVEKDFYEAMKLQDEATAKRGRLVVMRMGEQIKQLTPNMAQSRLRLVACHIPSLLKEKDPSRLPDGLLFGQVEHFTSGIQLTDGARFFERQLVILEDLGRSWVEALGVAFNIPPRVFAFHWASPGDYISGKVRLPLGQPAEEHFAIPYREILPLRIKNKRVGSEYKLNCSSIRFISRKTQQETSRDKTSRYTAKVENEVCEHMISYWGIIKSSNSWTGVLLVDPTPSGTDSAILHVKEHTTKIASCDGVSAPSRPGLSLPLELTNSWSGISVPAPVLLKLQDWKTKTGTLVTPSDPSEKKSLIPGFVDVDKFSTEEGYLDVSVPDIRSIFQPLPPYWHRSIFDELVRAPPPAARFHPICSTKFARRLVLTRASLNVDTFMRETILLTAKAMQGIEEITEFNFDKLERKAWQDKWRSDFFTHLWDLREDLELLGFGLDRNRRLLKRLADMTAFFTLDQNSPKDQDFDDLEQWDEIEATRAYSFKIISRTTDSYLQAAQATGAEFANIQALSSKKITALAAIFVPASLCAAVLAIPSFSGAGNTERFWIFWVVSVPLAIILAIFLFTGLPAWMKGKWIKLFPRSDERSRRPEGRTATTSDIEAGVVPEPGGWTGMSLKVRRGWANTTDNIRDFAPGFGGS